MNYEDIKKLMDDMGNSKIDALEIEFPEGMKISMKKNDNHQEEGKEKRTDSTQKTQNIVIETNQEMNIQKEAEEDENLKVITSPMVGTFYEASSPKEAAFVKVGDKVKKGDVLCIIEAMKLMNEIESEFDGEIVEVCVQNEEMVDFGKPLFKIK